MLDEHRQEFGIHPAHRMPGLVLRVMRLHGHDFSTICERGQCRCEAPKRSKVGGGVGVSVSGAACARWGRRLAPRAREEPAPAAGSGRRAEGPERPWLGQGPVDCVSGEKHAESAAGCAEPVRSHPGAHAWCNAWPGRLPVARPVPPR